MARKTNDDEYGVLLTAAKKAYDLHRWVEGHEHDAGSAEGENRWALIRYASAALAHFFGLEVKAQVEQQEGEVRFAGAQASLDFVGDQPAGPNQMKAAVSAFLESRPEFGDIGELRQLTLEDEEEWPEGDVAADDVLDMWRRAEPERGLPPAVVLYRYGSGHARPDTASPNLGWDAGDRIAAMRWCEAIVGGDDAPKPEAIVARYLEDLDLETTEDRYELLELALGVVAEDVHDEDAEEHPSNWSDDLWEEALHWARHAHRSDRGEIVEVVDLPTIFAPPEETVEALLDFFSDGGMIVGRLEGLLAEDVVGPSFGLALLLQAMEVCGTIEECEDGLRATENEPPVPQFLGAVALNLGGRRYAFDGLEPPAGAVLPPVDAPPIDQPEEEVDAGEPADDQPADDQPADDDLADDVDASAGVDAAEGVAEDEEDEEDDEAAYDADEIEEPVE